MNMIVDRRTIFGNYMVDIETTFPSVMFWGRGWT